MLKVKKKSGPTGLFIVVPALSKSRFPCLTSPSPFIGAFQCRQLPSSLKMTRTGGSPQSNPLVPSLAGWAGHPGHPSSCGEQGSANSLRQKSRRPPKKDTKSDCPTFLSHLSDNFLHSLRSKSNTTLRFWPIKRAELSVF